MTIGSYGVSIPELGDALLPAVGIRDRNPGQR